MERGDIVLSSKCRGCNSSGDVIPALVLCRLRVENETSCPSGCLLGQYVHQNLAALEVGIGCWFALCRRNVRSVTSRPWGLVEQQTGHVQHLCLDTGGMNCVGKSIIVLADALELVAW